LLFKKDFSAVGQAGDIYNLGRALPAQTEGTLKEYGIPRKLQFSREKKESKLF